MKADCARCGWCSTRCVICRWLYDPDDLADVDGQQMCALCIVLHVGDPWEPDRTMPVGVSFVGPL